MLSLLATWTDVFSHSGIKEGAIWSFVILLFTVGFIGTFVPILPGNLLILAACFFYYLTMGMEASGLAWQGLVFVTCLCLLSYALDWVSGMLGAKWFGSSKWGLLGAITGAIIGLFFGLPGLIVGPILGVFFFELLIARKEWKTAGKSMLGTVVGGIMGIGARIAIATGMIAWFVVDVFYVN